MRIPFLSLALFLFGSLALAQAFGHQSHFSRPETGATPTPSEKITGHCLVVAGAGNMVTQPCSNLVLTLTPVDGSAVLSTRSSDAGKFEFNVGAGIVFRIGINSRLYEVLSPLSELKRGDDIQLEVRQK